MDFSKFDEMVDLENLKKDIEEAGSGKYEEVPPGEYEVKLEKLELKSSKKGDPMVSAWFKILEGKQKGQIIFYNQVILTGQSIAIAKRFLQAMVEFDVNFDSYSQFAKALESLFEYVKQEELVFALAYGKNDKGYNTYEITDVFED